VEEVAQGTPWAKSDLRRDGTVQPCVSLVADTLALNYGVIITRCTKIEKRVQGFAIPGADADTSANLRKLGSVRRDRDPGKLPSHGK